MTERSLIDAIRHYQKDIERCPENKERMLRCIKRLYVMPIKVEHLQETGVGRSVNNLRETAGEVGDAATALVAKWKAMVTAEDVNQQSEDESIVDEEVERVDEGDSKISNGRISPDAYEEEHSIREKENIRINERIDKPKSEKTSKHSDKHSKETKTSKHSSRDKDREKESSSRKDKDSSSNKKHSSSSSTTKDKKDKNEKHSSSSKSEHKSSLDKEKSKHKEKEDKHSSKDKSVDKHSSKSKEHSSKNDKHSSKSSSSKDKEKDKNSNNSKEKDRDKSKDNKDRAKREKRSRSLEKEKDSRKSEKRKHKSKDHDETPTKKVKHIKQEKISSDEEEESGDNSMDHSDDEMNDNSRSGSESLKNHSDNSDNGGSDSENSRSDKSDDESEPESFRHVQIKQEPLSDSSSERNSKKKSSHSRHRDSHSYKSNETKHKEHRSEEMKPPSSSSYKNDANLKELIKENEKKIKKEKVESGSSDKSKKSKVKIETNQDGSIDSGSGASFADALMGFDAPSGSNSSKKKKKKEQRTSGEGSSKMSSVSSTSGSQLSGRSRSPSVCSTASNLSVSPTKYDRKSQDVSKDLTPDALLKKPVKLEPLSLDISSTLPEISTNYKPLPSINQSRHTPLQSMSEEQMFTHMTTKSQRTKVYSGCKYGHTATVPSLYSFCIQVLHDNIDGLEYTGGVPYEILKPLLTKLNAEQLLNLEHYNPYLISDTDDLWKFHCNKTFPKTVRDEMETWRESYLRCIYERELKLKRLTANISESMAKSGPARQAKLAYVDSVAKPPRNIARKQAKYGTGSSTSASPSSSGASTSGPSISQIAAAQNQAKKKEIVSKAVVGGYTPATPATEQVPGFNNPATAAKILKKKKAPLMAKALQLIKSNSRYKR